MPEYLAPGVFLEEVSFRSKSIEGVGTSTTAFAGPTPRGPIFFPAERPGAPVSGVPEVLTSFGEFERLYGGFDDLAWNAAAGAREATNYVAHAVMGFFNNGGSRLYFARTFVPGGTPGIAQSNVVTGTARFRARMPGSGYNGRIVARERRSPASLAGINAAAPGSLLRVGSGSAAAPARVESSPLAGTAFALANGQALRLQVTLPPAAAAPFTITVNAAPARAMAQTAPNLGALAAGTSLLVTVDGRPQTITIPAAAIADLNALLAIVNPQLRGASATTGAGADADKLVIASDRAGTAARVQIPIHNDLGFTGALDVPGTSPGNAIADLGAVTVDELNALLEAAGAPVTALLSGGRLVLVTDAAGGVGLQVDGGVANSMHDALQLPTTPAAGAAGSEPQYYVKDPAAGWRGGADGVTALPGLPADSSLVTISLQAEDGDGGVTAYDGVGLHPAHPRWIGSLLAKDPDKRDEALANPYWIDFGGAPPTALALRAGLLGPLEEQDYALTGGDDGIVPSATTAVPGAVAYADALVVLGQIPDISIVAAPAHGAHAAEYEAVQDALVVHVERLRYRFAVLDTKDDQTPSQARAARGRIDTTRAGVYYPWLTVPNPLARPGDSSRPAEIDLPPSGFLCGIYARTDVARGVWKAPANEVVLGALRAEREINTATNEVLNPEGVNCIRPFTGRGLRVWGARTASSDPEWKYINVRRYFIYLERSIDVSTQWAVFEPNGEALWANVRETVSGFLYNEWRNGALLGATPDEAFFVRCDRSTMTQNDLDNGRLVCLIGVAAIKPAEFVIFRIGQKTAEART